ncbi:hypothetical protein [Lentilactobacillus parafarraginis]|nr:hypothetical protein [Lentilactobacillus parafarraginis]
MSKLLIRITTVMILIFIAWGISQIIKNFIGIYQQGLWVGIGATAFLICAIILKGMWDKRNH